MFVHGGVSEDEEYLSDCAYFSIINQKWYTLSINDEYPGPALSNHTCSVVLPQEQRLNAKSSFYKLPERKIKRADKVITQ